MFLCHSFNHGGYGICVCATINNRHCEQESESHVSLSGSSRDGQTCPTSTALEDPCLNNEHQHQPLINNYIDFIKYSILILIKICIEDSIWRDGNLGQTEERYSITQTLVSIRLIHTLMH